MVTQATAAGRKYRIIEVVGRGGFGTVYRAEMIGTGGFTKQVAVKVLHNENDAPAEMLGRLRDEARILGLLRHRAIVGVDSLALFDQGWAVVMEFVPGVDVASIVQGGAVPPRVALEIVEEVASALHAAYAVPPDGSAEPLRLVHRDIKPSNIRVTAQGEVKVLDFGVARANFTAREARTSAYLFGSLKYMAIERLEGVETSAADIYSLGLVLAELLIGRDLPEPPRQAERYQRYVEQLLDELLAAIHDDPFQSSEGPTAGLLELVRTMLSDDHEQRPTASKVEHACRSLRQVGDGPWLRDWAAAEVPRLATELTVVERSADSGSVLVERSSSLDDTTSLGVLTQLEEGEDEPPAALVPRALLFGVLAGAMVGVAAVMLFFAWKWAEPAIDLSGPEPSVASGLSQQPQEPQVGSAEPGPDPADATGTPEPALATVSEPASAPSASQPASSGSSHAQPASPQPEAGSADHAPATETVEQKPAPGAHVSVKGDARSVWLVSASGRYPAGPVPPGDYKISAWFDSPDPAAAGSITLHDGERVTLSCVAAFAKCSRSD